MTEHFIISSALLSGIQ